MPRLDVEIVGDVAELARPFELAAKTCTRLATTALLRACEAASAPPILFPFYPTGDES